MNRRAEALGRDAPDEHLEARQPLALVREQRLDVVAEELEEQLVAGRFTAADLDEQARGGEQLGQRRLDGRDGVGVRRARKARIRRRAARLGRGVLAGLARRACGLGRPRVPRLLVVVGLLGAGALSSAVESRQRARVGRGSGFGAGALASAGSPRSRSRRRGRPRTTSRRGRRDIGSIPACG
jgi:hypothetical protein